jgi:hypothetical protein
VSRPTGVNGGWYQPALDHTSPDHIRPDQLTPDHMRPAQDELDHMRPDHIRPAQDALDHMRPDHSWPDHMRPAQLPPDHVRPDQPPPDHMRPVRRWLARAAVLTAAPVTSVSPRSSTPSARCGVPRGCLQGPDPGGGVVALLGRGSGRREGLGQVDHALALAFGLDHRQRRRRGGEQLLELIRGDRRALLQNQGGRPRDDRGGLAGPRAAEVVLTHLGDDAEGVVQERVRDPQAGHRPARGQ